MGWIVGGGGGEKAAHHADVVLAAVAPDVIGHLKPTQTEQLICPCPHAASPWVSMPETTLGLQLRGKGRRTITGLTDDEDALGQLPSPLPKRVAVVVSVERAMLCGKEEGAD